MSDSYQEGGAPWNATASPTDREERAGSRAPARHSRAREFVTREQRIRAAICDEFPTYLTAEMQVASVLRMIAGEPGVASEPLPDALPALPVVLVRAHAGKAQPKRPRRRPPLRGRTMPCPECDGMGYLAGVGSCGFCFGRGVLADPPLLTEARA